jgi:hypothetical protein
MSCRSGVELALSGFDPSELSDFDIDVGDLDPITEPERVPLIDRFIVPPFSVLDTRQGYWQERKHSGCRWGYKAKKSAATHSYITCLGNLNSCVLLWKL